MHGSNKKGGKVVVQILYLHSTYLVPFCTIYKLPGGDHQNPDGFFIIISEPPSDKLGGEIFISLCIYGYVRPDNQYHAHSRCVCTYP